MEWHSWCSCCANKINTKLEPSIKILNVIYKHFNVIHQAEQLKVCLDCQKFLEAFVNFQEKCRKVQIIFEKISSNHVTNSKHLYDMRIDAGLDSGGITIEADDEIMSSREHVESSSFESHFIEEMDDDSMPCDSKQFDSVMIENNTPDSDSPTRKLRSRAKAKFKKEIKVRSCSNAPTINKQQDNELVDHSKPMKAKCRQIRDIRTRAEFLNLNFCRCELCDAKIFENKRLYQEHMHERHPDESIIFNCSKCSKSFERWSSFRRHEQTHLPVDQRLIKSCDFCPKKFSNSSNAEVHVQAVHKKNGKKIVCDQCGKLFITMSALKEHFLSHSSERPFKCDFENCGKCFKSKTALAKHQETHSTEKRICNICGLGLSSRATLLRHMVVHSNEKRFSCKFCSQKFKRSKALKIHLILHTGLQPYSCPFCSYTCPNGANFRSHKKKYHANELAKLEASGETLPTVVMPKLKELQSMNGGEQTP